jgi:antitoxin PrlF
MTTLTLTQKSQVTLKQEFLRHLGVSAGEQIEVHKLNDGGLAIYPKAGRRIDTFVGCLPPPPRALSIDEMNALTADAWAKRR